ncbi:MULTISPECIES: lysyl oxidase family protein [unclassified Saccharothrix]|uniref:lysyl oxidase family protein n=1 Tax=unclassified Saccharothrix TaxID=2593673 RepID=UPI00307D0284
MIGVRALARTPVGCPGGTTAEPAQCQDWDVCMVADAAKFLRRNMCEMRNPSATAVKQGISVGSGDDYPYKVDFQWLDLTHVPSGLYDVVNVVNPDRSLVEKRYDNNASSIAIFLRWPQGAKSPPAEITEPPRVELIRSCPGRERCALQSLPPVR